MDINGPRGYKAATLFELLRALFRRVTESEMDKEFLSQIDRIDELVSTTEKLNDEILICECFCVNVADIREACHNQGAFDLKTMQDNFSLGHGCQGCLKRIGTWVHKIF